MEAYIFKKKQWEKKPVKGEFLSGKKENNMEGNKIELDFSQFILFYLEHMKVLHNFKKIESKT